MPDALELLHADHESVSRLFDEMGETDDPGRRRSLMDTIIKELSVHTALEEEVFYPAVADRIPLGTDFIEVSIEEHTKAAEVLKKLDRLPATDPDFSPQFGTLVKLVRAHVSDEESQLFARVRASIDAGELTELGERLASRRRTEPTRPHPHGAHTPPADVLGNRAAAALDRVRDAGRGEG